MSTYGATPKPVAAAEAADAVGTGSAGVDGQPERDQ
jgi:hypothetical protein